MSKKAVPTLFTAGSAYTAQGDALKPDYVGTYCTPRDLKNMVQNFYGLKRRFADAVAAAKATGEAKPRRSAALDLCWAHPDLDSADGRIGEHRHMFVDENNRLITIHRLNPHSPKGRELIERLLASEKGDVAKAPKIGISLDHQVIQQWKGDGDGEKTTKKVLQGISFVDKPAAKGAYVEYWARSEKELFQKMFSASVMRQQQQGEGTIGDDRLSADDAKNVRPVFIGKNLRTVIGKATGFALLPNVMSTAVGAYDVDDEAAADADGDDEDDANDGDESEEGAEEGGGAGAPRGEPTKTETAPGKKMSKLMEEGEGDAMDLDEEPDKARGKVAPPASANTRVFDASSKSTRGPAAVRDNPAGSRRQPEPSMSGSGQTAPAKKLGGRPPAPGAPGQRRPAPKQPQQQQFRKAVPPPGGSSAKPHYKPIEGEGEEPYQKPVKSGALDRANAKEPKAPYKPQRTETTSAKKRTARALEDDEAADDEVGPAAPEMEDGGEDGDRMDLDGEPAEEQEDDDAGQAAGDEESRDPARPGRTSKKARQAEGKRAPYGEGDDIIDTYDGEDGEEDGGSGEGDGTTEDSGGGKRRAAAPPQRRRAAADEGGDGQETDALDEPDAPYSYTKDDIQQQLARQAEKQARLSALLDIRSQQDKDAFFTAQLEKAAAELEQEQETGSAAMKYLLDRVGADAKSKEGALSVAQQMLGGSFGKTRAEKLAAQDFARVMAAAAGRVGSTDGSARNPALIEDEARRDGRRGGGEAGGEGGGGERRYKGKAGSDFMSLNFGGTAPSDGRSLTLDFPSSPSAARFGSSFFRSTFSPGAVRRPSGAPAGLGLTAPRGGGSGYSSGAPVDGSGGGFRRPAPPQSSSGHPRGQHSKVSGRGLAPSPPATEDDAMDLDEPAETPSRTPGGKLTPAMQKRWAALQALNKDQVFQAGNPVKMEKILGAQLPKNMEDLPQSIRRYAPTEDEFGLALMMQKFQESRPRDPSSTYENGFFHHVATNVLFPSLKLGVNPLHYEDFTDMSKLYDDSVGSSFTGFVPRHVQSGGTLMLGQDEDD